jgi:MFS family permease
LSDARRRRVLGVLAAGHGLNAMAGGFVYPYFALYLGRRSGAERGALTVGLVFAAATLLSALGRILGGEMADRRGRRAVVLASTGARSLLLAALAASVWADAGPAPIVLPFLLASVARGAFEPAADAMVADVIPPEGRARAYAAMRIARNAGWAVGPAVGGLVGGDRFFPLAFIAAGLGGLNAIVSAAWLDDTPHASEAARFHPRDLVLAVRDGLFRRHCLLTAGLFVLFAQLLVAVSIDLAGRLRLSSQEVGWTYMLNGVLVVALQALVTRAAAGGRPGRILALGALLKGTGFLVIGVARGLTTALAGMAVFTLGEMVALPLSASVAASIAPADRRGRYLGAYGVFIDAGHGLGQVLGGVGLAWAGTHALIFWWATLAFAVLLAGGYVLFDSALRAASARAH